MLGASSSRRRRDHALLLFILLLAAALRLWGLGAKSLWLDEAMTVQNASRPFVEMIRHLARFDAHPPLYQVIEWLWLRVGQGDGFVRLPSVVAGALGVWLAYLIARRLLGRTAGLAACLLMALSYFHIYYSQEARLNALVVTLFLWQTYLLLRILHQRGNARWGWWAAYGFAGLLCLYTYAPCVLTIGALAVLYLWLTRRRRRQLAQWVAVHVIIALLFLPWAPVLRHRTAVLKESIRQHGDAAGRPGVARIANGIAAWGFGPHEWKPTSHRGALLGLALLTAAGVALAARRTRRPVKILGTLFVLPLAGYLLLPMPRVQAYDPKHLIFLQPLLLIGLAGARASAARTAGRWGIRPLVYVILAVVALNVFALGRYYRADFQKENWRGLCADVCKQLAPEDLVLFNPDYVGFGFDYYARTANARAGASALLAPGVEFARAYERVWLIECSSAVSAPQPEVKERLIAKGWVAGKSTRYPGAVGEPRWTLLVRPSQGAEP